jgi:hypothetical protein
VSTRTPAQRIETIVAGVVRQAVRDAGARALIVLDDGSPEATLAHAWCAAALGTGSVALARGGPMARKMPGLFATHPAGREIAALDLATLAGEARRLEARLLASLGGALVLIAHPANKTALLLSPAAPPEPLLPLGDLYASEVRRLAGGYTLPPAVTALAEAAGGVEALDAALRAHFDERRPLAEALAGLSEGAAAAVVVALRAARFARRRLGLVPKLGARTLGIDLFA